MGEVWLLGGAVAVYDADLLMRFDFFLLWFGFERDSWTRVVKTFEIYVKKCFCTSKLHCCLVWIELRGWKMWKIRNSTKNVCKATNYAAAWLWSSFVHKNYKNPLKNIFSMQPCWLTSIEFRSWNLWKLENLEKNVFQPAGSAVSFDKVSFTGIAKTFKNRKNVIFAPLSCTAAWLWLRS